MNKFDADRKSVIKTFKIEATSSKEADASALQQQLSQLINTRVINEIEALFEKKIPKEEVYKLQQLELPIGMILKEELNEKLPQKILKAVDEALTALLLKTEPEKISSGLLVSSAIKANADLLAYYLEKGNLPWWFKPGAGFSIDGYISDMLQSQPLIAKEILQKTGKLDIARRRIAYQFTEENIRLSVQIIEPQEAEFIIGYHQTISSNDLQDKPTALNVGQFKKAAWYFILNYLLAERGSEFNRKEFLKSNLRQISTAYGISLASLSQLLYAGIETIKTESVSRKEIKNLLTELLADSDMDTGNDANKQNLHAEKINVSNSKDNIALLLYFLQNNSLPPKYAAIGEDEFIDMLSNLLYDFPLTSSTVFSETKGGKNIAWLKILLTKDKLLDFISHIFQNNLSKELVVFAGDLLLLAEKHNLSQAYDKAATLFLSQLFKKRAVNHTDQLKQVARQLVISLTPAECSLLKEHITGNATVAGVMHEEILRVITDKKNLPTKLTETETTLLQKGMLDYILFLIQYGAIPWWGQTYQKKDPGQLFSLLMDQSVQVAKRVVVFSGMNEQRRSRFFRYIGAPALIELINKAVPEMELQHLLKQIHTNTISTVDIANILWDEYEKEEYDNLKKDDFLIAIIGKWVLTKQVNLSEIDKSFFREIFINEANTRTGILIESIIALLSPAKASEETNTVFTAAESLQNYLLQFLKNEAGYQQTDAYQKDKLHGLFMQLMEADIEKAFKLIAFAGKNSKGQNRFAEIFGYSFVFQVYTKLYPGSSLETLLTSFKIEETGIGNNISVFWNEWRAADYDRVDPEKLIEAFVEKWVQKNKQLDKPVESLLPLLLSANADVFAQAKTKLALVKKINLVHKAKDPEAALLFNSSAPEKYIEQKTSMYPAAEKEQLIAETIVFYLKTGIYDAAITPEFSINKYTVISAAAFLYKAGKSVLTNIFLNKQVSTEHALRLLRLLDEADISQDIIDFIAAIIRQSVIQQTKQYTLSKKNQMQIWEQEKIILPQDPLIMLKQLGDFMQHNTVPKALNALPKAALLIYFKSVIHYLFQYHQHALGKLFLQKTSLYANKFILYDLWVSSETTDLPVWQFMQTFIAKDFFALVQSGNNAHAKMIEQIHPGYHAGMLELRNTKKYTRSLLTRISVLNWLDENQPIPVEKLTDLTDISWQKEYQAVISFFHQYIILQIKSPAQRAEWVRLFKQFNFLFIAKQVAFNSASLFLEGLFAYIFDSLQTGSVDFYIELIRKIKTKKTIKHNLEEEMVRISEKQISLKLAALTKQENMLAKHIKFTEAEKQEAAVNKAMADKIKTQLDKEAKAKKETEIQETLNEGLYINNAGIVLLTPFIVAYLEKLNVLNADKKSFISVVHQQKAMHCLQFLIDGKTGHKEFEMAIMKILCGLQVSDIIENDSFEMDPEEITIAENLIQHVISQWTKIGQSSIEGFRGNFLMRDGFIKESESEFVLHVEKRGYDILIQFIPWSFNILKLPWMQKPIITQWI